jgi:hypothetical protein
MGSPFIMNWHDDMDSVTFLFVPLDSYTNHDLNVLLVAFYISQ